MSKHNTPALRFEGFDGEWVSTTFGETAQLSRGLTYSPRDVVNANEGVRVYRSSNIQNLSVVTSPDDVWVNPKAVDIPFLTEGNILITASNGSVRLVGKSGIVKKLSAPGVPGGFMLKCVSAFPTFTAGLLQSPWYKDFLNVHVAGGNGAIGNLDSKRLSDEMVSLPSTSEEQRAIGELFADLDALIEQHRAKHANLQQTKTALLQRMFPQDGADEPELRLGGFSGAWETVSFDSLLTRVEIGTNILGSNRYHGVPLLKMGNIQRGYFDFTSFERLPDSAELPSVSLVRTGDFLFNTRNTMELVGKGATWMGESEAFAFNGNIARFTLERVDTKFFNYLYNHPRSIRDVSKRATGTTSVAAIYPRSLKSVQFQIPPLDEQRAIGEAFADLDALIAAEASFITQLTQAKTALLQRMFV